jgi:hypothetical protein
MEMCKKWASSGDVLTKEDIKDITEIDSDTFSGQIYGEGWSFEEFKHFKNVTKIKKGAFKNSNITSIIIPENVVELEDSTEIIGGENIITENGIFENCGDLRNVYFGDTYNKLPSKITNIPIKCFYGCNKLEYIVIPDSVKEIRTLAFGKTSFNKIIEKTDNITYNDKNIIYISKNTSLNIIDNGAFEEDEKWEPSKGTSSTSKLDEITIPNNLDITNKACNFLFSDNLRKINLINVNEDGYKLLLENNILYYANGDTKISIIKCLKVDNEEEIIDELNVESIAEINDYAFYNSNVVRSVKFSSSLGSIGYGTFYNSSIEHIDLSASPIDILPDYSFYNLQNVKSILLPINTKFESFGSNLFYNCINLTELVIPTCKILYTINSASTNTNTFVNCGVEKLEFPENFASGQSFTNFIVGCQNLKEVILPAYAKITNNSNVIVDCGKLEKITLPIFTYTDNNDMDIIVNSNIKWANENAFITNSFNLTELLLNEKDNNKFILEYKGGLYQNGNIEGSNIIKRNGLKLLIAPFMATDSSMYLENITVNNESYNIVEIGPFAFFNTKIETLLLPNSITIVQDNAFNNCSNLKSVELSNGLTEIKNYLFYNCRELERIIISESVESISFQAFVDCVKLSEIVLLGNTPPQITCLGAKNITVNRENFIIYYLHPFNYNVGKNANTKICYTPYNALDSYSKPRYAIVTLNENNEYKVEGDGFNIEYDFDTQEKALTKLENLKRENSKYDNYEVKEIEGYWDMPLFNKKLCNFTKKELPLEGNISLQLFKNGEEHFEDIIYLESESENFKFEVNNDTYSSTYNRKIDGYGINLNNKVSHNEIVYIYDYNKNYIGE